MFTGYTVHPQANPLPYCDQFICRISFMHGDGDHYTTEVARVEEIEILTLANFLELCYETKAQGEGGPGYSGLEGFKPWEEYFPQDVSGYECQATLDGYGFYYYDASGVEYDVNLEIE